VILGKFRGIEDSEIIAALSAGSFRRARFFFRCFRGVVCLLQFDLVYFVLDFPCEGEELSSCCAVSSANGERAAVLHVSRMKMYTRARIVVSFSACCSVRYREKRLRKKRTRMLMKIKSKSIRENRNSCLCPLQPRFQSPSTYGGQSS